LEYGCISVEIAQCTYEMKSPGEQQRKWIVDRATNKEYKSYGR